jgi:toxin-antitoxin system PIN domain toxin
MRALLDVNVLIALLDMDHVHHVRARDWLEANAAAGWASCPITQNGCVRVMSQPAYPNPLPCAAVIERLAEATRHPRHRFWPDDVSLLDPRVAEASRVHGPRQVTDLYLLALAVAHKGRLATFDGDIALSAIAGAGRKNLEVI